MRRCKTVYFGISQVTEELALKWSFKSTKKDIGSILSALLKRYAIFATLTMNDYTIICI